MHSYILINFTTDELTSKINTLASTNLKPEQLQNHPDIFWIAPQINKNTVNKTASIKIEDIRSLHPKLSHKPLQLQHNLVIIQDAHTLTLAAQNSFLKLLEEAPNSQIFLLTHNHQALIPTILSRCQIINNLSNEEFTIKDKYLEIYTELNQSDPIHRLTLIENSAKAAPDSQELLIQLLHITRQELIQNANKQTCIILIQNLQTCLQDLSANVNRKLALDQLCLNWDNNTISIDLL